MSMLREKGPPNLPQNPINHSQQHLIFETPTVPKYGEKQVRANEAPLNLRTLDYSSYSVIYHHGNLEYWGAGV